MTIATIDLVCSHGVNRFFSDCPACTDDETRRIHEAGRRAAERQHAAIIAAISGHRCRCQPTIEHHFATRESGSTCWACGNTIDRIPWHADFPPRDMNDRCINAFREAHHHAD